MNVYAEDWEKALQRQPGVRDCVVIGLERGGNAEPYAVLVMTGPGATAASAVERANQTLAEYQKIRRWSVWPEPDFPRTPTQKPILPAIREVVQKTAALGKTPDGDPLPGLIAQITGRPVQANSKRSEEHTSELQSRLHLVCRLLLEKKNPPRRPPAWLPILRTPRLPPGPTPPRSR